MRCGGNYFGMYWDCFIDFLDWYFIVFVWYYVNLCGCGSGICYYLIDLCFEGSKDILWV